MKRRAVARDEAGYNLAQNIVAAERLGMAGVVQRRFRDTARELDELLTSRPEGREALR